MGEPWREIEQCRCLHVLPKRRVNEGQVNVRTVTCINDDGSRVPGVLAAIRDCPDCGGTGYVEGRTEEEKAVEWLRSLGYRVEPPALL